MYSYPLRGYAYIIAYAFCSSLSYFAIEYVYREYPSVTPTNAAFFGFLGAVILVAPFFLLVPKLKNKLRNSVGKHGKVMLAITTLNALGPLAWFWALNYTSAGALSIINKTQFLFVFLLGVIFLHERMNRRELFGIATAILGLIAMAQLQTEVSLPALGLGLAAAFFYGLQSFLVKRFVPQIDGASFAFGRALVVGLVFGVVLLATNSIVIPPLPAIGILIAGELAALMLGRMLYFSAHNHLPITKLNFVALIEIVFVLIGAFYLFDEKLSLLKIIGGVCIASGAIIFLVAQKPKEVAELEWKNLTSGKSENYNTRDV